MQIKQCLRESSWRDSSDLDNNEKVPLVLKGVCLDLKEVPCVTEEGAQVFRKCHGRFGVS